MTKIWYPVILGHMEWDFPTKKAEMLIGKYVGEGQLEP